MGGLVGWSRRRSEVTAARVPSSWLSRRSRCPEIRALLASGSVVESTSPTSRTGFVLEHDHKIHVEYTAGVIPGITALTYSDGNFPPVEFTGSQITADETALGTLVSVPLERSVDTGSERFGFFLPQLDVPRGES